jgi:chromatin remodeling complex protein RSC6
MTEVKRIEAYDKKTRAEREELINLLESPRNMADTRGYEGSQGMNILHQTLVAADKTRAKQQQRKTSISQATLTPGGAAATDSSMNARDEVTRRFKKFSPKEGKIIQDSRTDLRIRIWNYISRENCSRSSTQIGQASHLEAHHCSESIQCI